MTWLLTFLLLMPALAFADYRSTILADSPLFYWRLEENSGAQPPGGPAFDTSGNAHTGTYTAATGDSVDQAIAPAFTTGCFSAGNNLAHNGTQERVEIADFSGLHLGTGNWTMEVWWKTAAGHTTVGCTTLGSGVSKGDYHTFPDLACTWDGVDNGPQLLTTSGNFGPLHLSHDVWHLIDIVRTTTTNIDWYVDGSLVTSLTIGSGLNIDNTDPFDLWFNPLSNTGAGDTTTYTLHLDEFAFYATNLSGSQISNHYSNRNAADTSDICGGQLRRRVYQMQ